MAVSKSDEGRVSQSCGLMSESLQFSMRVAITAQLSPLSSAVSSNSTVRCPARNYRRTSSSALSIVKNGRGTMTLRRSSNRRSLR